MPEKRKYWGIRFTRVSHEHAVIEAPTREAVLEILNSAEYEDEPTMLSDSIHLNEVLEQCGEEFRDVESFLCTCERALGHEGLHSIETFDELAASVDETPRATLLRELHMLVNPGEYGLGSEAESLHALDAPELLEDADYTEVEAYLEELKPWLEQEKRAWERVGTLVEELLSLDEESA